MTIETAASNSQHWHPTPLLRATFWLHGLAAAALALLLGWRPAGWPEALGALLALIAANHVALTALGLWPRSSWLGPNLRHLHREPAAKGKLALTLDDGPDPAVTPAVLELLAAHQARASFFLIGARAQAHPNLVRRIVAEGHSIENHTHAHDLSFSLYGRGRITADISTAQSVLTELGGRRPRFFRAPAGLRSPLLDRVLADTGLQLTSWTRRGFDTRCRDSTRVLERLAGTGGRKLAAGDILLLHDGHAARDADGRPIVLPVLERLLPLCRQRGLSVRPLDAMMSVAPQLSQPGSSAAVSPQPGSSRPGSPRPESPRPEPPRPESPRPASPRPESRRPESPRPASPEQPRPLARELLEPASAPYRRAGRFAYHFARGKLAGDPAFAMVAAGDWISPGARVLDLGCGQGLLAALLEAAGRQCRLQGIELMAADVGRARQALSAAIASGRVRFVHADIRDTPFAAADVAVILDVLHYIDHFAQELVLQRVRGALAPTGLLLLRVGDADAGLPFRISNWVDRGVTFLRGHRLGRLHCRRLSDWVALLEALGFSVRVLPASQGTPFANHLLEARLSAAPGANSDGRAGRG